MNKKYQMMVDNIQANLYPYDQNDTVQFLILSRTVTIFYHSVMSCSRQTDWSVHLFLAAGSSAADRGQAEAKCLRPRPRPRPKL